MVGVAVDRKLLYLGSDISLAAEGQVTQYFFGHRNTTFALGLGLQFDKLFGFDHTSLSLYTGPSFRANGRTFRLSPNKDKMWELYRVLSVSDDEKGMWIGKYRARGDATKVIKQIAYQPELKW
jgi:hypothetical protein